MITIEYWNVERWLYDVSLWYELLHDDSIAWESWKVWVWLKGKIVLYSLGTSWDKLRKVEVSKVSLEIKGWQEGEVNIFG